MNVALPLGGGKIHVPLINMPFYCARTKIKDISMSFLFKGPKVAYIWVQILNSPIMPYIEYSCSRSTC